MTLIAKVLHVRLDGLDLTCFSIMQSSKHCREHPFKPEQKCAMNSVKFCKPSLLLLELCSKPTLCLESARDL